MKVRRLAPCEYVKSESETLGINQDYSLVPLFILISGKHQYQIEIKIHQSKNESETVCRFV